MRKPLPFQQFRSIRLYAIGALPFLLVFACELAFVWEKRPATPIAAFTHAMQINGHTVYLSTADMVVTFGAFLIAAAIIGTGLWRTRPKRKRP